MSKLFAFDIGHASIGWSVLESTTDPTTDPEILGAGVVLFPTDDCLTKQRRNSRRTRRNIRATRQRIERLKRWLAHRGVLSRADLDKPGHPAPFLLAAAALQGHHTLNAWEFWTVLRWYAHNRGYDGNSRWARAADETEEDTEKVHTARELMRAHETRTMAETVCACLELDPTQWRQRISSRLPYKTLNAAFPREIVEAEVRRLFERHQGRLVGLDPETARLILPSDSLAPPDRDLLRAADIKLPRRFHGGLLFGQLVPRFDNRIIARCPITYAEVYDREKANGKTDEEAHHAARREAKVPAAHCPEFLEYRFARILANLRADGRPLDAETRRRLFASAKQRGYFTHAQLRSELTTMLGETTTNLDNYFKLHPDSEKALVLDPALKLWRSNRTLKALAPHLPEPARHKALRRWRANRPVQLGELWEWSAHHASAAELETALRALHQKETQKAGERVGLTRNF
jgi:CRISPR-associated endonuclease Csn1